MKPRVSLALVLILVTGASGCTMRSQFVSERTTLRKQLGVIQKVNKDDPQIYVAHMRLAEIEESRKDWPWAALHYEKALRFQTRTLGPDHLDIAETYDLVASFNLRIDIPGYSTSYLPCPIGSSHISEASTLPCQTVMNWTAGSGPSYQGAETAMLNALAIRRKHWGADSPALVPYLLKLCDTQRDASKKKEARASLAEARRIASVAPPPFDKLNRDVFLCTL